VEQSLPYRNLIYACFLRIEPEVSSLTYRFANFLIQLNGQDGLSRAVQQCGGKTTCKLGLEVVGCGVGVGELTRSAAFGSTTTPCSQCDLARPLMPSVFGRDSWLMTEFMISAELEAYITLGFHKAADAFSVWTEVTVPTGKRSEHPRGMTPVTRTAAQQHFKRSKGRRCKLNLRRETQWHSEGKFRVKTRSVPYISPSSTRKEKEAEGEGRSCSTIVAELFSATVTITSPNPSCNG
jgi:hypothetical protein